MAFASALEAGSKVGLAHGMTPDEFWQTLAAFVGYSMGNVATTTHEDITQGIQQFTQAALHHALDARSKLPGGKVN